MILNGLEKNLIQEMLKYLKKYVNAIQEIA